VAYEVLHMKQMNTSKWLAISVAVAICAGGLFVPSATAAEAAKDQQPLRTKLRERAKEKLGVTDAQVAKIKEELKAEKEVVKGLITKLHEARVALRESIQSPEANESTVRAASAKVAVVEADLAVERQKLFSKISSILTTNQREKLREFQAKMDEVIDNAISRIGERLTGE
jgi:periplasmic protein CpxP/Spy